ncbi:uncharacterized protein LOC144589337 [Pogona vitticeps]
MAAHSGAAAQCSSTWRSLWMFLCVLSCVVNTSGGVNILYSNCELMRIGLQCKQEITAKFIWKHGIPSEIARSPGSLWTVIPARVRVRRKRKQKERKKKRGCRAGVLYRLQKQTKRLPLPSLFLTNARSVANKMDDLRLQVSSSKFVKNCCMLLITETWLNPTIPNTVIDMEGFLLHRLDRDRNVGKCRGGGLCVFVRESWCTNSEIITRHCSLELEYLSVKCRPFYLPREFSVVIILVVYNPPDANADLALGHLGDEIGNLQSKFPDAVYIIAGDFNHVDLHAVLPKFHQHVRCATRGLNTLDKVYTNIANGYRTLQLPHLGQSDHMSLLLAPEYIPLRKQSGPVVKIVKSWPEGAMEQLKDCFEQTNWEVFDHPDLEEHTAAVLGYMVHCIDTVTVDKRIWVYPNQKPWMTGKVRRLLYARNKAFKSGDDLDYSAARTNLRRGIKQAKAEYKRRIEDCFLSNNMRQVWQGVQQLTNYKAKKVSSGGGVEVAEELNNFFA